MGLSLINQYKKTSSAFKTAFYATIIIGLIVHLFKFSNVLLNHDSLYNFYSTQNAVGSGRWFLCVACSLSSYFDLPWISGLLSLLYAAVTMVIIVALFHIENPFVIILSSGLLITFPGITETFFFSFTSDGYMLAMLLATLSIYLSRIDNHTSIAKSVASGVCICLSCGIYQAYVPFALILAVCHLVYEMMENRHETRFILQWIGRQILIFAGAMAVYYFFWKLCM